MHDTDEAVTRYQWPRPTADAYFRPNGVLLRMRLICFGVEDRGNPFRTPQDTAWWKAKYKFGAQLWDVLATLATIQERTTAVDATNPATADIEPDAMLWAMDEDLLKGDISEIAQAHLAVVRDDLGPFQQSKCEPPYLIPTFGGLTPLPNPKCKVGESVDKLKDKVGDIFGLPWWLWVLLGMALTRDERR
jgi:hypothetical protein